MTITELSASTMAEPCVVTAYRNQAQAESWCPDGYQRYAVTTKTETEGKKMKKLFNMLVVGMVWLLAGFVSFAQPVVGDSVSGASVSTTASKPARKMAGNGGFVGGIVNVRIIPVLGKPLDPGDGWLEPRQFVDDLINNREYWVPAITGPISWKSLVYAEVNGVATTDWPVVQQMVVIESIDDSNSISIDMVSMESVETPTGALSDVYNVGNRSYSSAAIGVRSDGTIVTGGPSNQMVSKIVMVFQMRLFTGGASKVGRDEARSWVLRQAEYTVTYKVSMRDREVRGGEASVTVERPHLTISRNFVTLVGDEPEYPYDIQYTEKVTGPWRNLVVAWPGDNIPITTTGTAKYFRATPRQ